MTVAVSKAVGRGRRSASLPPSSVCRHRSDKCRTVAYAERGRADRTGGAGTEAVFEEVTAAGVEEGVTGRGQWTRGHPTAAVPYVTAACLVFVGLGWFC